MSVKEQVRRLWKECFGDSEEFMDLYFGRRYTDEINTCLEEDGKVVSALQRIPYPMTCYGEVIPMAYISGACTDVAYRGRGLMKRLLASAHRRMYEEGKWLAGLIPAEEWLFGYYARSGYVPGFQQHVKLLTGGCKSVDNSNSSLEIKKIDLCKALPEEICPYLYEHLRSLPFSVLHTEEDFQIVLSDWSLNGGEVWAVYDGKKVSGLALCLKRDTGLLVREMFASGTGPREALLRFFRLHYRVGEMRIVSPSEGELRVYGMARIINAEQMLSLYARVHCDDVPRFIKVEGDEAIAANNALFLLEGGACRRVEEAGQDFSAYTISGLTRLFFEGHLPYMNLMLD